MDIAKIKHLLLQKSTWVLILSQIGVILQTFGVLDEIGLDKYNLVTTSVILILVAVGVFGVYQTEPLKDEEE